MSYCPNCDEGYNELSWLENREVKTKNEKCETGNGTGEIE